MASKTIEAAGGIVVLKGAGKLIAVVQRAKDGAWVLPRGKLKRDENPTAAARREVVEETGHRVDVHEFLGAITYRASGRPKVVQFWRMEAEREARHALMPDIVAVEWLPLKAAVRRLSYPLEKLFLRHAAVRALKNHRAEADAKPKKASIKKARRNKTRLKKARLKKADAKSGKALVKTGSKSRPAKQTRKLVKPLSKLSKVKAAKTSKAEPKDSKSKARSKAQRKAGKAARKSGKAERKSEHKSKNKSDRKSGKPKKDKGKKARREQAASMMTVAADTRSAPRAPQSARTSVESPEPARSAGVSPLPNVSGSHDETDERKTILQRMLGRLAG